MIINIKHMICLRITLCKVQFANKIYHISFSLVLSCYVNYTVYIILYSFTCI